MKREALQEALFRLSALLGRLVVYSGDALERSYDVLAERLSILERLRRKEPAAQDFGHVLLDHRLHGLFTLALEDVVKLGLNFPAQRVALARVGRQKRRDKAAPVHLGHRLGEVLEEVRQPASPFPVLGYLLAGVHQHLVDQDERAQPFLARQFKKLGEQVLGGRGISFLGLAAGVENLQARVARNLIGQDAPGLLKHPCLAVGRGDGMPFSTSSLSKHRPATRHLGGCWPISWMNSATAGRFGNFSGS